MTSGSTDIIAAWSHTTAEIPPRGLEEVLTATPEQRAVVAAALDLLRVDRLAFDNRVMPLAGGRYRLTGTLKADVVQACVVTLDPVPARITDQIEVEFRPAAQLAAAGTGTAEEEQAILDAEEVEPIENHRLAIGRVVIETLMAALPSHPRSPGAALEQHQAGPAEPGPASPFAALAQWKTKPE